MDEFYHDFDVKMKEKLFEILSFTIKFLDNNNLRWWIASGSCLGAVRHQNIIPWDDDIDICLPREDYNRLIKLKCNLEGTKYKIISYEDEGYYLPFAKIMDTTTTLQEHKRFHYVMGVFVDIFPVDNINSQDESVYKTYRKLFSDYQNTLYCPSAIDYYCAFRNKGLNSFFSFLLNVNASKNRRQKLLKIFKEYESSLDNDNGLYSILAWRKYIYPRDIFKSFINVKFGDLNVKIPEAFDKYLTITYGDYMTLPPVEKRVTHHSHYYINLKEGLTLEQVKERIKNGEHIVY